MSAPPEQRWWCRPRRPVCHVTGVVPRGSHNLDALIAKMKEDTGAEYVRFMIEASDNDGVADNPTDPTPSTNEK
ncbi:hypothetical protein IL306_009972 [Fusarium sp. DS 682]|nr:hypothetical protein IL306_009972 [Fusarium sp. DS 682]